MTAGEGESAKTGERPRELKTSGAERRVRVSMDAYSTSVQAHALYGED